MLPNSFSCYRFGMKNAILIHGTYGNPEENWFPWLTKELEGEGYEVTVPAFPTPAGQDIDAWQGVFASYGDSLDPETILIGHSLGAAFVLDILERSPRPIRTAYLVAGFLGPLGNQKFDTLNRTFVERSFDWETIKQNAEQIFVIASDNDPYVPESEGYDIASRLETEPIIVEGAGHFNTQSGYEAFEGLLHLIREQY